MVGVYGKGSEIVFLRIHAFYDSASNLYGDFRGDIVFAFDKSLFMVTGKFKKLVARLTRRVFYLCIIPFFIQKTDC